jgi:hypothetical protein
MPEIKFISKTEKEKALLSRKWLPVTNFKAWQTDRGSCITRLDNILKKYIEGFDTWPEKFDFLDCKREQTPMGQRTYFRPKQVLSVFRKMRALKITEMFDQIKDGNKRLRENGPS